MPEFSIARPTSDILTPSSELRPLEKAPPSETEAVASKQLETLDQSVKEAPPGLEDFDISELGPPPPPPGMPNDGETVTATVDGKALTGVVKDSDPEKGTFTLTSKDGKESLEKVAPYQLTETSTSEAATPKANQSKVAGRVKAFFNSFSQKIDRGLQAAKDLTKATPEATGGIRGMESSSRKEREASIQKLSSDLKNSNADLLNRVKPEEFDAKKFDSTDPKHLTKMPNLRALVDQQESIQSMVKHHVMTGKMPTEEGEPRLLSDKERKNLIESYVELAATSRTNGDFLTANAVTAALNSAELTPIMNNTEISKGHQKKLGDLQSLQFQKSYFEEVGKFREEGKGFIPAPGPTFTSITQKADQTVGPKNLTDPSSDASKILDSFPEGAALKSTLLESGEEVPFDTLIRAKHKSDFKFCQANPPKSGSSDLSKDLSTLRSADRGQVDGKLEGLRRQYSAHFKGNATAEDLMAEMQQVRETSAKEVQATKDKTLEKGLSQAKMDKATYEGFAKDPNALATQPATQRVISANTSAYGSNVLLRKYEGADNAKFTGALDIAFVSQMESGRLSEQEGAALGSFVGVAKECNALREELGALDLKGFYNDTRDSSGTGRTASASTEGWDYRIVDDYKSEELSPEQRAGLEKARARLLELKEECVKSDKDLDGSTLSQSVGVSVDTNVDRLLKEVGAFLVTPQERGFSKGFSDVMNGELADTETMSPEEREGYNEGRVQGLSKKLEQQSVETQKKAELYLKSLDDLQQKGLHDAGGNIDAFNTVLLRERIEKPHEHKQNLTDADPARNLPVVHLDQISSVTDPGTIAMRQTSLQCGVEGDPQRQFTLDASAALKKGTGEPPMPKAMGEDAHVLAEATVNFNGQTHHIPLMATLDGGGGHQLAQYGQAHLKEVFQEELGALVKEGGKLDQEVIGKALKKTNDRLFGRNLSAAPGEEVFTGEAYGELRAGHAEVRAFLERAEFDAGASAPETAFKSLFGKRGLNPEKCHKLLQQDKPTIEKQLAKSNMTLDQFQKVQIGKRTYDLAKGEDAKLLQEYYTKATGTIDKIECQVSMTAFYADENHQIVASTFNRGDSQTAHSSPNGAMTALSPVTSALENNLSTAMIQPGSRITGSCDGHREKISMSDQQSFDEGRIDLDAGNYTYELIQASVQAGSADDITIVSAKVNQGWGAPKAAGPLESEQKAAMLAPKEEAVPPKPMTVQEMQRMAETERKQRLMQARGTGGEVQSFRDNQTKAAFNQGYAAQMQGLFVDTKEMSPIEKKAFGEGQMKAVQEQRKEQRKEQLKAVGKGGDQVKQFVEGNRRERLAKAGGSGEVQQFRRQQEQKAFTDGYKAGSNSERLDLSKVAEGLQKAYKEGFSQGVKERNADRMMQASGKQQTRFKGTADVEGESIKTSLSDRSVTGREMKGAGGISLRGNEEESVRAQTAHGKGEAVQSDKGARFERIPVSELKEKPASEIRSRDLSNAFSELHRAGFGRERPDNSVMQKFQEEFDRLLDETAHNPSLKDPQTFKEKLFQNIREQSVKEEEIDRDIFADLIGGGGAIPSDVFNAPEFNALKEAFDKETWKEGEDRTITLSWFNKNNPPEQYLAALEGAFQNPDFSAVLSNWLNK